MKDSLKELLGSKRALLTVLALAVVVVFVLVGRLTVDASMNYFVGLLALLGVSYAHADTQPPAPPPVPGG